ncbi:MAG: hypothetical protein JJ873_12385 [Maricaulis sp.]|uniref:hypothetical protein n=1 Tax=Maricaulis sp. TaxID=1486257 RepID=UPI001B2B73BC|nr:hypothetical protein [Maricaulis sp.]MBO6728439.1 hypothetical protein [Maricaulis sp.]MBO6878198.1 hypothetical protein [Maricaulis sp.]
MLFPTANPADVFDRLSRDDTVFHVGPSTGRVLFNAYRKCAASFVISEPDTKIASELTSALLSSPSVDLIDQAVAPDGADVELHRYSPSSVSILTKAEEPAPTLRCARHTNSVSVRGIDPVAYLKRKRGGTSRSDVLVVSDSALHLGVLIQLQAAEALSRFEYIIIRCDHANAWLTQLDQAYKLLKDCGFDAQALYAASAQSESLGLFRRNRLADEVARLNSMVVSHADEIEALRGDYMRAEMSIEDAESFAQEQGDLAEAREGELAAVREQMATSKAEESKLIAKLATLDGQLKETSKASKAGDKKLSQVTRKLERAEQRAKTAEKALARSEKDLAKASNSEAALTAKLDKAEEEIGALKQTLSETEARAENERQHSDGLEKMLADTRDKLEQSAAQTEIQAQELANRQSIIDEFEDRLNAALGENDKLSATNRQMRSELEALKGILEHKQSEIKTLQDKLQRTTSETGATIADIEHQRTAQAQIRAAAQARAEKLATETIELRDKGAKLRGEVAELTAKCQQGEERLLTLREDLIQTRKSRDDVSSKLDAAVRLQSSLRDDLADLQTRYGELIDGKHQQDELVVRLIDKLSSPMQGAKPSQNSPKRSKTSTSSKGTTKRTSATKTGR